MTKDDKPARERILEAAIEEFAEHGLDGVRMEHVARRARCNKSLVYRYFTDREGLFHAALERRFSDRQALLDTLPESFGEILAFWAKRSRQDPVFMKMILREALEHDGKPPPHATARRAYYARQVDLVRRLQSEGQLAASLDPEMLFVALLSVVTVTTSIPQIVELATGARVDDPEFERRWEAFLNAFARVLREGPAET